MKKSNSEVVWVPEENFVQKSEQGKKNGGYRDPERGRKESHIRVEKPISRDHVRKIKLGMQHKLLRSTHR